MVVRRHCSIAHKILEWEAKILDELIGGSVVAGLALKPHAAVATDCANLAMVALLDAHAGLHSALVVYSQVDGFDLCKNKVIHPLEHRTHAGIAEDVA
jgi:hypothetical protein